MASVVRPVVVDGKTLHAVTVTRIATLYVLAPDEDAALADAAELGVHDWEWHEESTAVVVTDIPSDRTEVWSGGPDGSPVVWRELVAEDR